MKYRVVKREHSCIHYRTKELVSKESYIIQRRRFFIWKDVPEPKTLSTWYEDLDSAKRYLEEHLQKEKERKTWKRNPDVVLLK